MNWFTTIPALVVFVVVIVVATRAFVTHRRLVAQDEARYRQYVADMEAVGRRFTVEPEGCADSEDTSSNGGFQGV